MKIAISLLPVLVAITIAGCATSGKINNIGINMTKQEVVEAMGKPKSTASPGGGVEILRYTLYENSDQAFIGVGPEYYVKLVNGRVDSYGRMGDFGSTQNPTYNINVDKTVRQK